MSVNEKMTAIADAIRDKTGSTEKLGLDAMASGIGEVYAAGYAAGQSAGGGSQIGYDEFWDSFQKNGNRTDYTRAFMYWTDKMYQPKYGFTLADMAFVSAQYMYAQSTIVDLSDIYLRSSTATNFAYTFEKAAQLKKVGTLYNSANNSQYTNTFFSCESLESIERIKITSSSIFTNTFLKCYSLEKVTFSGNIGRSISFSDSSKLTAETVEHIFEILVAPTATNQALTFHADTVLTEEQIAKAEAMGWQVVQ